MQGIGARGDAGCGTGSAVTQYNAHGFPSENVGCDIEALSSVEGVITPTTKEYFPTVSAYQVIASAAANDKNRLNAVERVVSAKAVGLEATVAGIAGRGDREIDRAGCIREVINCFVRTASTSDHIITFTAHEEIVATSPIQ